MSIRFAKEKGYIRTLVLISVLSKPVRTARRKVRIIRCSCIIIMCRKLPGERKTAIWTGKLELHAKPLPLFEHEKTSVVLVVQIRN